MSVPQLIFGCASIGEHFKSKEDVQTVFRTLKDAGIGRVDTAARYPPTAAGMSERLLGEAGVAQAGLIVDTKIDISGNGRGSLTATNIDSSLQQSLESLQLEKINVLYCHAPDNQTPLEEQAAAFDSQYRQGKFSHLGISNFDIDMVEKWIQICEEKDYVKPSVYQGQYNLFCRRMERDLLPALRKHQIHYVAYSPLAGGFLTGKLTPSKTADDLRGTRFEDGNMMGRAFRHWYDKPGMHAGIERLQSICKDNKVGMDEAAMRWLVYHSVLGEQDAVILGASKVAQIEGNTRDLKKGPLPGELVKELDALWEVVKEDALAA